MPLICFASPKGGVGKTTLAANVAGHIARSGTRVVALDLDPQNSLRLHFGVPLGDGAGFTSALAHHPDWRAAARQTAAGVLLLAYGASDMPDTLQLMASVSERPTLLNGPVEEILADPAACVIVDTPPGPSPLLAALLPLTDLLVTVLLVDATSASMIPTIESGAALGARGSKSPRPDCGFVLNQLDTRARLGRPIAAATSRHFGERLLGIVYRDEHVAEAIAAQKLLADYAPAAKATHDVVAVADRIVERVGLMRPAAAASMRAARIGWMRR